MKLGEAIILQYHKHGKRVWLSCKDNHRMVPGDLLSRIADNIPDFYTRFKDGELFAVTAKGRAKDDSSKVEVEITRLVNAPANPLQTLENWSEHVKGLAFTTDNVDHRVTLELLAEQVMFAQVFEFGEVDEQELMKERARAVDLMNKGFLKLPYECVLYRFTGVVSGRSAIIASQGLRDEVQWTARTDAEHFELLWPLSLLLTARGTRLTVEQPALKLQAKRAAHNKPPLPTITRVDAKHWQAAARAALGGTHASPIPHLRRGHLRHYQNGHVKWIKDTLVNCKSLDEAFPRQQYEVVSTKESQS